MPDYKVPLDGASQENATQGIHSRHFFGPDQSLGSTSQAPVYSEPPSKLTTDSGIQGKTTGSDTCGPNWWPVSGDKCVKEIRARLHYILPKLQGCFEHFSSHSLTEKCRSIAQLNVDLLAWLYILLWVKDSILIKLKTGQLILLRPNVLCPFIFHCPCHCPYLLLLQDFQSTMVGLCCLIKALRNHLLSLLCLNILTLRQVRPEKLHCQKIILHWDFWVSCTQTFTALSAQTYVEVKNDHTKSLVQREIAGEYFIWLMKMHWLYTQPRKICSGDCGSDVQGQIIFWQKLHSDGIWLKLPRISSTLQLQMNYFGISFGKAISQIQQR